MSSLLKLYPYKPEIVEDGVIHPRSIHPKQLKLALTLLTMTFLSAPIAKTTSYKWAVLGAAVFGYISYLFWSKLDQWVPNTIADRTCIEAFLSLDPIPDAIARRVMKTDKESLHDEIFNIIASAPADQKRDALLEHYFVGVWKYITIGECLTRYLKTLEKMTNPVMNTFQPSTSSQMTMWTAPFYPLDVETGRRLMTNFDISSVYNYETPLSNLAKEAIFDQNASESKFNIGRMALLLKLKPDLALNLSGVCFIYEKSSLGLYLQSIQPEDENYSVALLLKKHLSSEGPLQFSTISRP